MANIHGTNTGEEGSKHKTYRNLHGNIVGIFAEYQGI